EIICMPQNHYVPVEAGWYKTLSMFLAGYRFIPNRCYKYNTPLFQIRLLGKTVISMRGHERVAIFYDPLKIKRNKHATNRVLQSLLGEGGVQGMDGVQHDHRKEMFMSLMTPDQLDKLRQITEKQWHITVQQWMNFDQLSFFAEVE